MSEQPTFRHIVRMAGVDVEGDLLLPYGLAKIKGVSKFQASVICNAVQGRTFKNKNQLIAFFGLDVQVKQSGTWRGKEKLSKRGNSFYRMILFQLGWSLARNNEIFNEYYQRLRDNEKHYYNQDDLE